MFYLIKEGKIVGGAETYLTQEGCETVFVADGELLPQQIKEQDINRYREIEKEAINKRSEYLTAELLPLGQFRDLKLAKLEADRIDIENRYNAIMTELIEKYGNEILNELL